MQSPSCLSKEDPTGWKIKQFIGIQYLDSNALEESRFGCHSFKNLEMAGCFDFGQSLSQFSNLHLLIHRGPTFSLFHTIHYRHACLCYVVWESVTHKRLDVRTSILSHHLWNSCWIQEHFTFSSVDTHIPGPSTLYQLLWHISTTPLNWSVLATFIVKTVLFETFININASTLQQLHVFMNLYYILLIFN